MLILTRKPGQTIKVGDDITVAVLGVSGGQVRIGIEAPQEMKILRDNAVKTTPSQKRVPS